MKTIVDVYELPRPLFQGVYMEIESDTDSDDCNEGHAAKHNTLADVMRLEFDNAERLLSN